LTLDSLELGSLELDSFELGSLDSFGSYKKIVLNTQRAHVKKSNYKSSL
jgi:hypothetical protein